MRIAGADGKASRGREKTGTAGTRSAETCPGRSSSPTETTARATTAAATKKPSWNPSRRAAWGATPDRTWWTAVLLEIPAKRATPRAAPN